MGWLLRRLLSLWVRYSIRPEDVALRMRERANPVCYVLERRSLSDRALLRSACAQLKLVRPHKPLSPQIKDLLSCFYLSQPVDFWRSRPDRRPSAHLVKLIAALQQQPALDIDLVPVAVYWGRAPQKEASWFRLLLVENWRLTSRLRKFFQVLLNGRATLIEMDDPISLRALMGPTADPGIQARRVTRTLRGLYRQQRSARIGPDLSHRRTILTEVLRSQTVRNAVTQKMREKKISRRAAMQLAIADAEEIAANYSHAFIRFLEILMTRFWNKVYDGIVFLHSATLSEVTEGHEVVYVPCHRSHMDYLLLSYAIFREGYAIPHIAAGVNLNMPVIGRFLRKGGAFFIRRSLRGNALYTVVFGSYLAAMMRRGHPLEYFIEGGRSRTGRLLQPNTGMLLMTVRSHLRNPQRPLVFVPVYFGYERVVEAQTYINELAGRPKEKESIWHVLKTLRRLHERFGHVYVNLGRPVFFDEVLRRKADSSGLNGTVDELAHSIMQRINAAAVVTPINLLAVIVLAAPRQALPEADLAAQITLYCALLRKFPYSDRTKITALSAVEIIEYGEALKSISREKNPLGDLIFMTSQQAALAAYFRNNVLHLFAIPSLLACAFDGNSTLSTRDLQRLAARVYPYIAAELFLQWREDELAALVLSLLNAMAELGLIEPDATREQWSRPAPASPQAMQLSVLGQATIQTLERYYLAVALLLKAGSGQITRSELEQNCQLMAQRIAALYGFESPEFSDRSLFAQFIGLLRERGVVRVNADGQLEFDEVLRQVAQDAQLVLNERIRHSILQVTHL
jgi:glycerol-3-phosphate O-acyltransferase